MICTVCVFADGGDRRGFWDSGGASGRSRHGKDNESLLCAPQAQGNSSLLHPGSFLLCAHSQRLDLLEAYLSLFQSSGLAYGVQSVVRAA